MGRVADDASEVRLRWPQESTHGPMHKHGHNSRPEGNEHQRVGELPVIFQEQDRVRGRTDQHIEIGSQAGHASKQREGPKFARRRDRRRSGGANNALAQRVQGRTKRDGGGLAGSRARRSLARRPFLPNRLLLPRWRLRLLCGRLRVPCRLLRRRLGGGPLAVSEEHAVSVGLPFFSETRIACRFCEKTEPTSGCLEDPPPAPTADTRTWGQARCCAPSARKSTERASPGASGTGSLLGKCPPPRRAGRSDRRPLRSATPASAPDRPSAAPADRCAVACAVFVQSFAVQPKYLPKRPSATACPPRTCRTRLTGPS